MKKVVTFYPGLLELATWMSVVHIKDKATTGVAKAIKMIESCKL